MSIPFDTSIKILYLDPLVSSATITFSDKKHREDAVEGDFLLNSYICKLDEEIFSDPPKIVNGEEQWNEDDLSAMSTQLMDKARIHGYAVVQFYDNEPTWRVFSECDRTKWLYDKDDNVIGIAVHYGKETDESLIFGENQCYLLKFKEGDNKGQKFALADLDQAMWTVATMTRQIQAQLDIMGSRPEMYHVVYGSPSPDERQAVINSLDDTNVLNAFAASENAVKEIRTISHQSYSDLLNIIALKIKQFAGITRMPLAFYNGERTSGSGTGGAAENMVEIKIDRRKQHIFNKIKPILIQIYKERYNIALQDIEMDTNTVEENSQGEINGQKIEGINSQKETLG